MSEPFIKEAGKGLSLLVRVAAGVFITAGMAGLGWIAYQFMGYAGSSGVPRNQTFSQVTITSPQHGAQVQAGDSLMVEAVAIGENPFQRLELWINGDLLGVQTAPDGGVHPFSTYFLWRPVEPGLYSLAAIAVDMNGDQTISEQVLVMVESPGTVNVFVSGEMPIVLPAPQNGGAALPAEIPSDANTGPSAPWSPSVGNWITSLSSEEKPAAPGLAARAGECMARLYIHDLSENEEGFVVYRQMGISRMWEQAAALRSQAEFEWVTYEDLGVFGPISYYVTAFNNEGEASSNLVFVNIDPAGCSHSDFRRELTTFSLSLHPPEPGVELLYCYISTDGVNWARWPQSGFLPVSTGAINAELVSLNLLGEIPGEDQRIPPMSILLDCWGWAGGELQHVGQLDSGEILPQPGSRLEILGAEISAELVMETTVLPGQSDLFSVGANIDFLTGYFSNLDSVNGVSPQIPRANLTVTFNREVCGDHLPPDAQNLLGQLLYCYPYPAYDLDQGATNPQPYLIWGFDFEPICEGGVSEQCKSYWELLSMAEETGGEVGFTIFAVRGGSKTVWNVTEPNLTMFVVPPIACIGSTDFSVRLWYRPGQQGAEEAVSPEDNLYPVEEMQFSPPEILYGPYSNWVSIPCNSANMVTPTIVEHYKEIRVNFTGISFSKLDDGGGDDFVISSDKSVELYGYFRIQAPSFGHWDVEHCFTPMLGTCDTEPYWTGTRRYLLVADWEESESENLMHITTGVLTTAYEDLQYRELCLAGSKYSCTFEGQSTPSEIYNNSITVIIKEGDVLTVEMQLVDYDELSGDDEVCVGSILIPTEEFIYDSLSDPHSFQIIGADTDSGQCILSGSIDPIRWITTP